MAEIVNHRLRDLGGGVQVRRILPMPRKEDRFVGPFCFLDHMGPHEFEAGGRGLADVRPHPHIGLATLTYLFSGEIVHRDGIGSEQSILAGDVNWMVAGSGITHSERFERMRKNGGTVHALQAWVALPEEFEETEPSFMHVDARDLPSFRDDGIEGRLLAGRAFGLTAPGKPYSPLFYVHLELDAGARGAIDAPYDERAIYVVRGEVEIDGKRFEAGQMAVIARNESAAFFAPGKCVVVALGGDTIGPRHMEWNFVSSRKERIEQAKADWRAGRIKLPVHDDREFVPLPGDPDVPANPLS